MRLVVGLGNPGRRYAQTRHNVGFDVIAELARRHGQGAAPRQKFQSEVQEVRIGSEKVLLLSPLTFMNLSGNAVRPARDFYQVENEQILVVCDDFSIPLGRLRFRPQGSSGGQKGLADIVRQLGTERVPRLRVGIGPVPDGWDVADFVLGKFNAEQQVSVASVTRRAADGVEDWIDHDLAYCMNKYNADDRTRQEGSES